MATPYRRPLAETIQQRQLDALAEKKGKETGAIFNDPLRAAAARTGVGKGISETGKYGEYAVQTAAPAGDLPIAQPAVSAAAAAVESSSTQPVAQPAMISQDEAQRLLRLQEGGGELTPEQRSALTERQRASGVLTESELAAREVKSATQDTAMTDAQKNDENARRLAAGLPSVEETLARQNQANLLESQQTAYQKAQEKAKKDQLSPFFAKQGGAEGVQSSVQSAQLATAQQRVAEQAAADPNVQRVNAILAGAEDELRRQEAASKERSDLKAQARLSSALSRLEEVKGDQRQILGDLAATGALADYSDEQIAKLSSDMLLLDPRVIQGVAKQAREAKNAQLLATEQSARTNAQAQIKDLGENVAFMSPDSVGKLYQQAGYSYADGVAIQATTQRLKESKNAEERAKAIADLDLVLAQAEKTRRADPYQFEFQARIAVLNDAFMSGAITQEDYDNGIAEALNTRKDDVKKQYQITGNAKDGFAVFDPSTGEVKIRGGIAMPTSGSYGASISPYGGVSLDVNSGDIGGQCGAFSNKIIGSKVFGNEFSQKSSVVNSLEPIAGSFFVMDTGTSTGHVGYVESVDADGTINIVDSNWGYDEKVRRTSIRPSDPEYSKIVGYYIPPSAITSKDVAISQIKNGLATPTEVSALRKQAEAEGWLGDLNDAVNDPKIKPISATTALQFKASVQLNQGALEELINERQKMGFGNRSFQSLDPEKDVLGFQQFVELGDRLDETLKVYTEFKEKGGTLSGALSPTGRAASRVGEFVFGEGAVTDELDLYRRLEALTGDTLAEYVKSMSGAAVSDKEFARLAANKPTVYGTNKQFEDQLVRMMQAYEDSARTKASVYGFESKEQMLNAIRNYGKMPDAPTPKKKDDPTAILSELGYDTSNTDIINSTLSPGT